MLKLWWCYVMLCYYNSFIFIIICFLICLCLIWTKFFLLIFKNNLKTHFTYNSVSLWSLLILLSNLVIKLKSKIIFIFTDILFQQLFISKVEVKCFKVNIPNTYFILQTWKVSNESYQNDVLAEWISFKWVSFLFHFIHLT